MHIPEERDQHRAAPWTTTNTLFSEHTVAAHAAIEALAAANSAAYGAGAGPDATGKQRLEPLNRFSSRAVPPMSLWQLGAALARATECGDEGLLVALVLMTRFCEMTNTALTMKMAHRLYIAALHVALKAHSDRYYRNDSFATMAGISSLEMNVLEYELVWGLRWRLIVRAAEVAALCGDPVGFVECAIPRLVVPAAIARNTMYLAPVLPPRSRASHTVAETTDHCLVLIDDPTPTQRRSASAFGAVAGRDADGSRDELYASAALSVSKSSDGRPSPHVPGVAAAAADSDWCGAAYEGRSPSVIFMV